MLENRPGAGTTIATDMVVRSQPDGYTLLWTTTADAINMALYARLNYNFLRDISPVACVDLLPLVMAVNSSLPVTTVPEFIAYAKANAARSTLGRVGSDRRTCRGRSFSTSWPVSIWFTCPIAALRLP